MSAISNEQQQEQTLEAPVEEDDHASISAEAANTSSPALVMTETPAIDQLPPLPSPRYRTQRNQSLCGIAIVLSIAGILVGLTQGIALTIGFDRHSLPWWIFFVLIYSQAGFALVCLMAILWVNPGVVPRTAETCYPIPPEMATWLATRQDQDRPSELYLPSPDKDCRDTYCTRCLVWRRVPVDSSVSKDDGDTTPAIPSSDAAKYFHCNVCQRCVGHFDHHCDFFGRCIAGPVTFTTKKGGGNIKYFWGIIGVGATAYVTCLAAMLGGLIHAYDPRWVVPFFFLGMVVLHFFAPCFQGLLGGLRRFFCAC